MTEMMNPKDPVTQMLTSDVADLMRAAGKAKELRELLKETQRLEHKCFSDGKWLIAALQLLKESGIEPSSKELLAAYKRAAS